MAYLLANYEICRKGNNLMSQYEIKEPPEEQIGKKVDQIQSVFPRDIFNSSKIKIDKDMPSLKLNRKKNIQKTKSNRYLLQNIKLEGEKNQIAHFYKPGERKSSSIYYSKNSGEEKAER